MLEIVSCVHKHEQESYMLNFDRFLNQYHSHSVIVSQDTQVWKQKSLI